ncbi:CorA family divalent cation transporter [Thermoproteus tenax]|uniref:Magnesium and cobalt transport protein n=1 Tax=Thermoproteus tenax (strain ATCC 35583 / DSM 2078 / JCM 9277 / NBRC 100435 / Kra 1) TaxID=768679 RepID=G4RQ33_THETK|nr:CorA family divalent cation transporter [Thermoproteus tenax]CCC81679.1 magnesium and cobalt transport protein [Thermoproteus tenax Kra 1]
MYNLNEEDNYLVIELASIALKDDDIVESRIVLKTDRAGAVLEGGYKSVDDALNVSAESLLDVIDRVEAEMDKIEYALESDLRVEPMQIYDVSYLVHAVYDHAMALRALANQLARRRLVKRKTAERIRYASRRAAALRRGLLDLRLLYLSQIQSSINISMKRMTLVSTLALPAILISSIYGMNLSHIPLADNPLAVFGIMALASAIFALLVYRM